MSRPIASVHVDLARLGYEYSKVSLESAESAESLMRARAKWIDDLVSCLLLRDPSRSSYGAHLLAEVEMYRKAESRRKKALSNSEESEESAESSESSESADSQPRTDRADRSGKNTRSRPGRGNRSQGGNSTRGAA